jgi:hypothetical protein
MNPEVSHTVETFVTTGANKVLIFFVVLTLRIFELVMAEK